MNNRQYHAFLESFIPALAKFGEYPDEYTSLLVLPDIMYKVIDGTPLTREEQRILIGFACQYVNRKNVQLEAEYLNAAIDIITTRTIDDPYPENIKALGEGFVILKSRRS